MNDGTIAALFIIIFIVLAMNFYVMFRRMKSGKKPKKMSRFEIEEAKYAEWRDKEIARRIAREHEDALERVKLRNETLALYDQVRRRALERETEGYKHVVRPRDRDSIDYQEIERLR